MSGREYGVAQICFKGHLIDWAVEEFPERRKNFCDRCGEATITNCPSCEAEIQGIYWNGDRDPAKYRVPLFCHNCGQPYPWTKDKLLAAHALAQDLEYTEDISSADKKILIQSIDEMVKDTPKTELAATRFKRILSKINKQAVFDTFRVILVDLVSETAKKIIWPGA